MINLLFIYIFYFLRQYFVIITRLWTNKIEKNLLFYEYILKLSVTERLLLYLFLWKIIRIHEYSLINISLNKGCHDQWNNIEFNCEVTMYITHSRIIVLIILSFHILQVRFFDLDSSGKVICSILLCGFKTKT